jgi:hypothetical protein
LSAALESRIASLEAQLAASIKSQTQAPQTPAFDVGAFKRAFVANPIGVLGEMGVNEHELQHIQRVHVAHQLGDSAPHELKMLAQMGPQISATNTLASSVEAISRRLDERDQRESQQAVRSSFASLVVDKSKYPHLSAAYAADPSMFDTEVAGYKGNAAELATALETRQAKIAAIYRPAPAQTASDEDAENKGTKPDDEPGDEPDEHDQSKQVKPALAGTMSGDPPIPQQKDAGLLNPEEDAKLKAQILRKYNAE